MGEGWVGISPDEIEVGFAVHPTQWNRGIATEVALLVAADFFGRVGLDRLVAVTTADNAASLRTLEKIGMRYRGETEDEHDHTTYAVFELTPGRQAWVARRGRAPRIGASSGSDWGRRSQTALSAPGLAAGDAFALPTSSGDIPENCPCKRPACVAE